MAILKQRELSSNQVNYLRHPPQTKQGIKRLSILGNRKISNTLKNTYRSSIL